MTGKKKSLDFKNSRTMGWGCPLPPNRNDMNLFKLEHPLKVGGIKNEQPSLLEINYYCIYFKYTFGVNMKSQKTHHLLLLSSVFQALLLISLQEWKRLLSSWLIVCYIKKNAYNCKQKIFLPAPRCWEYQSCINCSQSHESWVSLKVGFWKDGWYFEETGIHWSEWSKIKPTFFSSLWVMWTCQGTIMV